MTELMTRFKPGVPTVRRPEPWYWQARKGWYVQLDGKQVKLGSAEKTKVPPPEVMREFHRLMAVGGLMPEKDKEKLTTPDIVELFIESKAGSRPNTIACCKLYLQPLALKFKSRRLATIKPAEVLAFVSSQAQWGMTTRYNAFRYIKGLFKWAKETDYLESNPIATIRNPYHAQTRERGISLDEFRQMIEATPDEQFRAALRFLFDTGSRPSEFCQLSARHLHPSQPIAILDPAEHKTGGRTGKKREIYLTGDIEKEVRELAKKYPDGPLYRNTKGGPWNTDNVEKRVKRLRVKLGLGKHVIPYGTRHGHLTRLIENGTDIATAAKIAGHAGIDVIQRSYFHPERARMIQLVNDNAGNLSTKAESPDEEITRLKRELAELRAKQPS